MQKLGIKFLIQIIEMRGVKMQHQTEHSRWGMAGGTLISVLANLHLADVLSTVVLAAVGAGVSYTVSFLLKKFFPDDDLK